MAPMTPSQSLALGRGGGGARREGTGRPAARGRVCPRARGRDSGGGTSRRRTWGSYWSSVGSRSDPKSSLACGATPPAVTAASHRMVGHF